MIQIAASFPRPWISSHRTEPKVLKISEVSQNGLRWLWISKLATQVPFHMVEGTISYKLSSCVQIGECVSMHICAHTKLN